MKSLRGQHTYLDRYIPRCTFWIGVRVNKRIHVWICEFFTHDLDIYFQIFDSILHGSLIYITFKTKPLLAVIHTHGFWIRVVMWSISQWGQKKHDDVIMGTQASQITSLAIVYSTVYSDADLKNIQAPRHWPLYRIYISQEKDCNRANPDILLSPILDL